MIAAVAVRTSTYEGREETPMIATDELRLPAATPEKPGRRARERGQGTLYQRGSVWWVQYFVRGRRVRESAETTNRRTAQDFLNARLGRAAEGRPRPPRVDKIGYAELAADLRLHYQTTNHRDAKDVELRLRPLDTFFAATAWLTSTKPRSPSTSRTAKPV